MKNISLNMNTLDHRENAHNMFYKFNLAYLNNNPKEFSEYLLSYFKSQMILFSETPLTNYISQRQKDYILENVALVDPELVSIVSPKLIPSRVDFEVCNTKKIVRSRKFVNEDGAQDFFDSVINDTTASESSGDIEIKLIVEHPFYGPLLRRSMFINA